MKTNIVMMLVLGCMTVYSQVTINTSYKKFTSIEEAMKNPDQVKHLDLSLQQLKVLPPEVLQLKNLEYLDLSFNHITDLPAELSSLPNLKVLDLSGCRRLKTLPPVVKNLPALQELRIIDIPEWPEAKKVAIQKELPKVRVIYQE